jgi:hypothetical protein
VDDQITVNGYGFIPGTTVRFGSADGNITQLTATRILVRVPAMAQSGPLRVSNANGTTFSDQIFTFANDLGVTLTGAEPASAPAGATVKLNGVNLNSVQKVLFSKSGGGTTEAIPFNASSSSLFVVVPSNAITGPVRLLVSGQIITSNLNFSVLPPPLPVVDRFEPRIGKAGDAVTVFGSNLGGVDTVLFGVGNSTQIGVNAAGTELTVIVPQFAVPDVLTLFKGTTSVRTNDTFEVIATVPIVTSFMPLQGNRSSAVTIFGFGLELVDRIEFFNGQVAVLNKDPNAVSLGELVTQVPPNATTGSIKVKKGTFVFSSSLPFTVTNLPGTPPPPPAPSGMPVIDSFSPTSGSGGTQVVIRGKNLATTQKVFFGLFRAGITYIADNQVNVEFPDGCPGGKIKVETAAGSVTSAGSFLGIILG